MAEVSSVSNVSFGRLYLAKNLQAKYCNDKNLLKQRDNITSFIRENKLSQKKNVDIFLQHNNNEGFYGVISSKKQGTPMNPAATCAINLTKKSKQIFKNWVNAWDDAYSEKSLNTFRNLISGVGKSSSK